MFVVLAGLAMFQQSRSLAPKFEPSPLFPGLAAKLTDLGEIAITSKTGTFHLKLAGDRWTIPEKDSFPADGALVRATGAGVGDMMTLEPKTAREDWLPLIGLDDPATRGELALCAHHLAEIDRLRAALATCCTDVRTTMSALRPMLAIRPSL